MSTRADDGATRSERARTNNGVQPHTFTGTFWLAGWLFTIAFAKLGFWKAVLGILIWPYFLGTAFN